MSRLESTEDCAPVHDRERDQRNAREGEPFTVLRRDNETRPGRENGRLKLALKS
jgi:hypothetical protein